MIEGSSLLVKDTHSHILMSLTSFFSQTLGWYLIKTNLTKIPAHKGSLLLIGQPVLATVWGMILFKEPMSAIQFAGVAMASGGIGAYLFLSHNDAAGVCE
jgi:drug/metabolite transporter (DMT)-like permease